MDTVELFFLPDIARAEMERQDRPRPRAIGSLHIQGATLLGNLSMATDALDGEPLRWRKALIRHYDITAQHNEEDYYPDYE